MLPLWQGHTFSGLMFAACVSCWAPHLAEAIKTLEGSQSNLSQYPLKGQKLLVEEDAARCLESPAGTPTEDKLPVT